METIILLTLVIVAISATIYLSLRTKDKCPHCRSKKIIQTGERKYLESPPIALWGSPDSYYEFEYKCENCNQIFWKKQKAVITN
jgi:DNA-directed RNA polymerase subunit RPC12/RpoP